MWSYCCSVIKSCLTPWTAACQASLSLTISWSLLKLMLIESVIPSKHFTHCHILLLLPAVFPCIRVVSNELALCIRWPKHWSSASASVLPVNIQGWFLLGLTSLTSLLPKGLSRVFSSTTVQKHHCSALSRLYDPTLISIHDYWKKHSFGYRDLSWQDTV